MNQVVPLQELPSCDLLDLKAADVCRYLATTFDVEYYTERYPDMALGLVDPLEHYVVFGWKECWDPCAWFSTRHYLAAHVDVAQKGVNPLLHYILYGQNEGRRVWPAGFNGPTDLEIDHTAILVTDANLRELIEFPPRALQSLRIKFRPERLSVHWIIPDFSPGSGGHMTIFRIIRWLEIMGHDCTIWIQNPVQHVNSCDAFDDIIKHFQTIRSPVEFVSDGLDKAKGDIVIATGWQTVPRALNAVQFRERFYFVQDNEASFHPMGSSALIANWSYTQEFACICAGPWLASTLTQRFGRWTRYFDLAYDHNIYQLAKAVPNHDRRRNESCPRIALYARLGTARRAVELVLLALEHLAATDVKFHVLLFGEETLQTRAPFPCTSHGVLNAQGLADLYHNAEVGVCFSTTNYSLVPQEMMACGLPVVEIDGDSTRSVYPEGVVTFTAPHPLTIATTIKALLHDSKRRRKQAAAALRWVAHFDWEASARTVEHALLERLKERGHKSHKLSIADVAPRSVKATVCIPTYNGGALLLDVVERVRSQRTPWPFEIVVVDSSSTDGSIESLASSRASSEQLLNVTVIPKAEFQHGRTRNLCASFAKGEFIAFLTQDALPSDEFWLYNLTTVLERYPNAAGAFGRHIAWPTASAFIKRDILNHFANISNYPLALARHTRPGQWESADPAWRQILHYFSDNNSCLRKSIWSEVPFPEVEYGEDQIWADKIIQLGYEKVYVPSAAVYHSHDHSPEEAFARAETEAFFFATTFGYQVYDLTRGFEEQVTELQAADVRWGRANGVGGLELKRQHALDKAVMSGRKIGAQRARDCLVRANEARVEPRKAEFARS